MPERVLQCPQCTAPLKPGPFSRTTVCPFCGSTVVLDDTRTVSADRFHRAYEEWNAPERHGFDHWFTLDGGRWSLGRHVASGEISEVFYAQRARWPTERVLLKVLRDGRNRARFDHEWQVLEGLRGSRARGASVMLQRVPRPAVRGIVQDGAHAGAQAMAFGRMDGFDHTFQAVRRRHREGIEPRAAIWVWRRILEVLAFLHTSGLVHGAVLPPHLLVQNGEHGVLLVGYGCAGAPGSRLRALSDGLEDFYPTDLRKKRLLQPPADLAMTGRSIAYLLGGSPDGDSLPDAVPEDLAKLVRVWCDPPPQTVEAVDAWELRERLGRLAHGVFGDPVFCPIPMPAAASSPDPKNSDGD